MSRAVEDKATMLFYCFLAVGFAAVVQAGLPEAGGFRYAVNDFNGNEQSHQQNRGPGNAVNGQYKVLLPDGRLQTVTYIADEGGYRAKVDYTPAAPGEATTAGKGLPLPATSRFSSVIGNGYVSGVGGGFGASAFGAAPYGAGAIAAGALGAAGSYGSGFGFGGASYGGMFNQFSGGYGAAGFSGGAGYGGSAGYGGGAGYGGVAGYGGGTGYGGVAGYGGAAGYNTGSYGGFGGGNNYGAGVSGGYGYSSPIFGALGYNPIGHSSASPAGYSYGYSTPFSQVYSYSNILG
ncbi:glycine-rich cell wall structural protein 2-like [Daphnia pulex]|uniref:glycine-rich cell wall structural protein 2-like n=1 Tax=Daphnia pulex TaxID=6669 RepID=UPI001EE00CF8|nr:glycine-rich cell wall structural protein 2-like [Daphnia pulex]